MYIKQIDMDKALELASKGVEVPVLVPTGPGSGWESMVPDTLQNLLSDVMFFRKEPAMEKAEFTLEALTEKQIPPSQQEGSAAKDASKVSKNKRQQPVDTGKIMALRNAGWSYKKIAEEMRVSEGTVYNRVKEMEAKKDGQSDSVIPGAASGAAADGDGADGK